MSQRFCGEGWSGGRGRRLACCREQDAIDVKPFVFDEYFRIVRLHAERAAEADTINLKCHRDFPRRVHERDFRVRQHALIIARHQFSTIRDNIKAVMWTMWLREL